LALNEQQERFAHEYVVDLNATQAAIRAGYSPKTAASQGERLLRNVEIRQIVEKSQAERLAAVKLTAETTLEAIRRPLAADVRKLFTEKGNVKPLQELSDEEAALIGGFEVILKNAKAGDGVTDEVLKLRLVDRSRYVEMAAKHFSLLTEKLDVNVNVNIVDRLAAGRKRVADAKRK
jgi:phage terminase small subunit